MASLLGGYSRSASKYSPIFHTSSPVFPVAMTLGPKQTTTENPFGGCFSGNEGAGALLSSDQPAGPLFLLAFCFASCFGCVESFLTG